MKINLLYTPDQFTEISFDLIVPAQEMKEIDLLKQRIKELETSVPILFYEKLTGDRKRDKGWNTIKLDYVSDVNNKWIKSNTEKGTIVLAPGKYVIKAEGTAHYAYRHIIQMRGNHGVIKLNGTPQRSNRNAGYSTSTSRLAEHVIEVKQATELSFMWWFQDERSNGG